MRNISEDEELQKLFEIYDALPLEKQLFVKESCILLFKKLLSNPTSWGTKINKCISYLEDIL